MEDLKKFIRYKATELFGENVHITAEKRIVEKSNVHWHNYFEIEIVLSGQAEYMLNGKEYTITRGDAYLLTPVDFHSIKSAVDFEIINISFDEEMLTEKMLSILTNKYSSTIIKLDIAQTERLIKASELLIYECASDGLCKMQLCEYIALSLIKNSNDFSTNSKYPQIMGIGKAILYLDLHFREDLKLTKLAEISGFNTTYFSELFRQVTGENFTERLTNLRINYAKTLLKNGFSVTTACYSSGFGSLSNFLAVFKKKCKITPSDYKKRFKTI